MTSDRRTVRYRPSARATFDGLSPRNKKAVKSRLNDIKDNGPSNVPAKNIKGTKFNGHVYKMWVNPELLMVFTIEPHEVNVFDIIKRGRYDNLKNSNPNARI